MIDLAVSLSFVDYLVMAEPSDLPERPELPEQPESSEQSDSSTDSNDPNDYSEENQREALVAEESHSSDAFHRLLKVCLKVGVGLGGLGLVAVGVFAIWGDRIITNLLLPRITASIDNAIDRPTKLGDVESISFNGVRLGETIIPPTESDPSFVTVDAIEISIGLRSLIFQQTVKSNVVLVRPDLSLIQTEDGTWTDIELPESDTAERRIKLEIQSIEAQGAHVIVVPYVDESDKAIVTREPIELEGTDALVQFFGEDAKDVDFSADGELIASGQPDSGEFELNGEGNLDAQVLKANLRIEDIPAAGANFLLPDTLGILSGELDGNLTLATAFEDGSIDQNETSATGTARLDDGGLVAEGLPAPVSDVRAQVLFKDQTATVEDASLQLDDIVLNADGTVDLKEGFDLNAQIPSVMIEQVQALADVDLPVEAVGAFQLDARLLGDFETPMVEGTLVSLGAVQVDDLEVRSLQADFGLDQSQFDLDELLVIPEAGGTVVASGQADISDLDNPTFQLSAQADLPADAFAAAYGVSVPGDIAIGELTADIEAAGSLDEQTAFAQWQLSEGTYPGTGELVVNKEQIVLDNTRLQIAGGTANAEAILHLETGDWQADITAQQLSVDQLTTQLAQQFSNRTQGVLSADITAAGNLDTLDPQSIEASGTATIADAAVQLTDTSAPVIERGDWQTAFVWEGDAIALETFTAPGITAEGTIGVDLAQSNPIDGFNLDVALSSFNLRAINSYLPPTATEYAQLAGFASFNGQLFGNLQNPQLEGTARLNELAINEILFEPLSGPIDFALAEGGQVDLRGHQDRLQLAAIDSPGRQLPFWPTSFEVRNQDVVANGYTRGDILRADVVQLPLERLDLQPALQYGFGTVRGLLQASVDVNLANFSDPRATGTLTITDPSLSPVDAEQLTASFAYANNTTTVRQGELLLDDSRYLLSGSANLAGEIEYEGVLTIAEGRIEDLVPIAQQINLAALGMGEAPDPLGSASDLSTTPVGLPDGTLLEKLSSFVAFLAANPPEENDPGEIVLPDLEDLEGEFTGTIEVAGQSLSVSDATADFDIRGDSWEWGTYTEPNEFALVGEVADNALSIETAFVDAGETQVQLTGSGDMQALNGELTVANLPVELVNLFYPLPAEVTGDLDVIAQLNGSLANPQIIGTATVPQPVLNGYELEGANAEFNYRDAVLALESEIAVATDRSSITLEGQVPYALPFMTVQPRTDQLAITAVAPNDTLEIVNALSDGQLLWQSGQGEVIVEVGGTLSQPAVNGRASFANATVSSPELRNDLRNINGEVLFSLEEVSVEQLQAEMGDGRVLIAGSLPLLPSGQSVLSPDLPQLKQVSMPARNSQIPATLRRVSQRSSQRVSQRSGQRSGQRSSGLTIALEQLPIDYDGLLEAVLQGQVLVTGAVLEPTISGGVEADDGQIQANQLLRQAGALNLPTTEEVNDISPYRAEYLGIDPLAPRPVDEPVGVLDRVTLNNFELVLGDRLAINGQPLYNLSAIGSLNISGPLSNPQPLGTIELRSGWINLFSTQFRLDQNAPNTATFTRETGLDPSVDVVMKARVQDVDIGPATTVTGGFLNADVNEAQVDTTGSVEYVRVRAIAQGPASELSDSLFLTSDPPREQDQLIALLGNNVFSGVTGASLTQVAGFLGRGTLSDIGNTIADTVGLNSFSVFPTTDTGGDSVGIGIGVEATASIGNSFNVSFLEVLNSTNPPQLGVEYRLTDEFTVRSDSNLNETEFELEYRIEF